MLNKDYPPLYSGKHLEFLRTTAGWEYVRRAGSLHGVTIVAVDKSNELLLVEQKRPPLDRAVIELPAGLVAATEDEISAVRRELIEETGYDCDEATLMCRGATSPGLTDETNAIYLVSGLALRSGLEHEYVFEDGVARHPYVRGIREEGERITVYKVPLDRVLDWLGQQHLEGKVIDLKVYAGLFFAFAKPKPAI